MGRRKPTNGHLPRKGKVYVFQGGGFFGSQVEGEVLTVKLRHGSQNIYDIEVSVQLPHGGTETKTVNNASHPEWREVK